MNVMDVTLYRLSIPFAIATGCAAGVLAVLTWEVLRDSPFGLGLKLFATVMSLATIYHGGLLVTGSETLLLQTLLIVVYVLTLVALLTVLLEFKRQVGGYGTVKHQYVLVASVLGILTYSVGGPISEIYFPAILHWVHGFAALSVIGGLYVPVHDNLQTRPWGERILRDVKEHRESAEWMMPIDGAILEILSSSGLILTPAVVAFNIDYSRDEVNRRLRKLEEEGLVEREERGKYQLTDRGERYLQDTMDGTPRTGTNECSFFRINR